MLAQTCLRISTVPGTHTYENPGRNRYCARSVITHYQMLLKLYLGSISSP